MEIKEIINCINKEKIFKIIYIDNEHIKFIMNDDLKVISFKDLLNLQLRFGIEPHLINIVNNIVYYWFIYESEYITPEIYNKMKEDL